MKTSLRCGAIEHDAEVQLAIDRRSLLDEQPLHLLALRAGLVRDELHAEDLLGVLLGLGDVLGDLDAAAFAAAAGVDLRLDDDAFGAAGEERLATSSASSSVFATSPARHGNAVLRKDVLCLILVDFHRCMCRRNFS